MRKSLIISGIVYLTCVPAVQAKALFNITTDGSVARSVLGEETETIESNLKQKIGEVAKAAGDAAGAKIEEIVLQEIEQKTHLRIETASSAEEQILGKSLTELVSIQESEGSEILINKSESGFLLIQGDVSVETTLPLVVKPKERDVFAQTVNGQKKIEKMPVTVLGILSEKHVINRPPIGNLVLQTDGETLIYTVRAERAVNIFNLTTVVVPVTATVNAETGEVINISQPGWLSLLGQFLV